MFRHTHKYAYLNIIILGMITLIYFLSTNHDAQSAMANAVSNPRYKVNGNPQAVAFVSWYDGDAETLEVCAQAADACGAKLNVFVTPEWLFDNKDKITYTLNNGHICGIYGKQYTEGISADDITSDISGSKNDFAHYAGQTSFYMPNNGEHTRRLGSCANKLGMQAILWSKDSRAYIAKDAAEFAAQVIENADNGDFMLVRIDARLTEAWPQIMTGLQGIDSMHLRDMLQQHNL